MPKAFRFWLLLLFLGAAIVSCDPKFDASVKDLDLAITRVNEDQNFENLHSFYLYDTVVYIGDDEAGSLNNEHEFDELILASVRQNLLDLGWVELSDTTDTDNTADVSIQISALAVDAYFYYTYWWDYWYWYPWDWWYPGYPNYPFYPVYPSYPSYSYTIGTVLVDMIDSHALQITPRSTEQSGRVPIVWTGAVNGILAGSSDYITQRIQRNLDQVFEQSPYLNKN